jgi:hypothetical protein
MKVFRRFRNSLVPERWLPARENFIEFFAPKGSRHDFLSSFKGPDSEKTSVP